MLWVAGGWTPPTPTPIPGRQFSQVKVSRRHIRRQMKVCWRGCAAVGGLTPQRPSSSALWLGLLCAASKEISNDMFIARRPRLGRGPVFDGRRVSGGVPPSH